MSSFNPRFLLAISVIFLSSCGKTPVSNSPEVKQMINLIDAEIDKSSVHTIVDSSRRVIQKYTQHSNQFVHCDDMPCVKDMAVAISKHIQSNGQEPKMLCSHRTLMQRIILEHYGLKSRQVNVVNKENQGHVFLEVKNGEKWEVTDSDYNIYYKSLVGEERMSLKQIIKKDSKDFVPCSEKGCSWEISHGKEASIPKVLRDSGYHGFGYVAGQEAYINATKLNVLVDENWVTKTSEAVVLYYFKPVP